MLISLSRALKYALKDFGRNLWLSFITVTIIGLAILSFNFLLSLNYLSQEAIKLIENKIDVSVYFTPDADENQIGELKNALLELPELRELVYINRDEALVRFKEKHKDDQAILKSLGELKNNPLGGSLIVRAKRTDQYPEILQIVERPRYQPIILDKNFDEHKQIIERIDLISTKVEKAGIGLSLIFTLIAVLVMFNTLRVIIYTHRDEIKIMKLVGATSWFVRLPYLFQGVIYSTLSLILVLLIWLPFLNLSQPYLANFFQSAEISAVKYFWGNFLTIYGIQYGAILFLSLISSWVAVNRYLKV